MHTSHDVRRSRHRGRPARLQAYDAELVGEQVHYEDKYRLCYVRGREGIIVGLAEHLRLKAAEGITKESSGHERSKIRGESAE